MAGCLSPTQSGDTLKRKIRSAYRQQRNFETSESLTEYLEQHGSSEAYLKSERKAVNRLFLKHQEDFLKKASTLTYEVVMMQHSLMLG